MSDSKHTPGPWIQCSEEPWNILDPSDIYEPDEELISEEETPPLYGVLAEVQRSRYDETEWRANGRLIAAAPDLLEALIMVRDADDDLIADGYGQMPPAPRAKIDAAIAKAEGK